MGSIKLLFMTGITIGLYFTVAIVYILWAIASFQWWLLIFAVLWAGFGLLNVHTAKKNFESVEVEFGLAHTEGMIDAYVAQYGSGDNDHKTPQQVADEAEKA